MQMVCKPKKCWYYAHLFGGIAQLVERLHGMQEVSGSIPLTSTKILKAWLSSQAIFIWSVKAAFKS